MPTTTRKTIALAVIAAPMLGLTSLGAAFLRGPQDVSPPQWHFVASLSELADDGAPHLKPLYQNRSDAWTRLPDQQVGQVFVHKEPGSGRVTVVPGWHHDLLEIPLRYDGEEQQYKSSCWNVAFDLEGKEVRQPGVRMIGADLAHLPVRITGDDVWVWLDSPVR